MNKKLSSFVPTERIEKSIILVRGEKVMLDEDLAELYGVKVHQMMQAVKRNGDRFPKDFMFQLSIQELRNLKSQFVISSLQSTDIIEDSLNGQILLNPEEIQPIRNLKSQNDSLKSWGGRRVRPYVFTEQGVAMLSSVLNSPRAVAVNVEIMRTFVKLRQMISSHAELSRKLTALEEKYDERFKAVFDAIRQLMTPPEPKKKRKIGF